jgi:hypothetical protein
VYGSGINNFLNGCDHSAAVRYKNFVIGIVGIENEMAKIIVCLHPWVGGCDSDNYQMHSNQ